MRPKYMSDEIAFWLPNFSRAKVGASSEAAALFVDMETLGFILARTEDSERTL